VDNGSSSQTIATLSQWQIGLDHNRVELICLKDNLGFAGGMNRGIEICKSNHEPDYLWLLNNDLETKKQCNAQEAAAIFQ
jgi:GT2 family glycosyltransferase